MAKLIDLSDIASLAETLHRTANTASHFAALCEQKDEVIADRDAAIIALKAEMEQYSSNEKKRKK